MNKTVYPVRSQVVNEIFSQENRFDKILIVPLDHAKTNHTVQFCYATGEHLFKKAMTVYNDPRGLKYLIDRLRKTCKN